MAEHLHHDWRVDPNQVIIMLRDQHRVRVLCADPACRAVAMVITTPTKTANPTKPETWRPYKPRRDDVIQMEL